MLVKIMSEQLPRFYNITTTCPRAGNGHCCLERHKADIASQADTESKTMTINDPDGITTLRLTFEPSGPTKLHVYHQGQRWETPVGCDLEKVATEMHNRNLKSTSSDIDHILDVTSKKFTVHTHIIPDCPLPVLLRQKKS